jgi:hypothetical protein
LKKRQIFSYLLSYLVPLRFSVAMLYLCGRKAGPFLGPPCGNSSLSTSYEDKTERASTARQKNSIQCWGSVTFWCGSGSGFPDPYLWLMDPDPALEPTTFFNDLKDLIYEKKNFIFFLVIYPQVHHLQS